MAEMGTVITIIVAGVVVVFLAIWADKEWKKKHASPSPSPSAPNTQAYHQQLMMQQQQQQRASIAASAHLRQMTSQQTQPTPPVAAAGEDWGPSDTLNTAFSSPYREDTRPCLLGGGGASPTSNNMDALFSGTPFTNSAANDPALALSAQQPARLANLMPQSWNGEATKAAGIDNWAPNVMNKQGYDKFVKASGDFRYAVSDRHIPTYGKGYVKNDAGLRPAPRTVINPNAQVMFNDSENRMDTIYALTGRYPTNA